MISLLAKQLLADVSEFLPSASELNAQGRSKLQTHIESALKKANIVSREEFETQAAVLLRTRQRVEALEKQLAEIEKQLS